MAQTLCILGGFTYPYNPPKNALPNVRAVSITETLTGRTFTDFGVASSRRDIMQEWPVLDAATFAQFDTFGTAGGTQNYVHDDGTAYTVIVLPPTYERTTPGGDAYVNVQLKMYVVSRP